MGSYTFFSFILCVFILAPLSSATPFLSYDIFKSQASQATKGRFLLSEQKSCSVNFNKKELYTVLTSQCKGPEYPTNLCCERFKQIACPYTNLINDAKTDCAASLFDNIDIFGKYPTGLFFKKCKEGEQGLDCSKIAANSNNNNVSSSSRERRSSKSDESNSQVEEVGDSLSSSKFDPVDQVAASSKYRAPRSSQKKHKA